MQLTNRELKVAYALTCLRELELANGRKAQKWADLRTRLQTGLGCNSATADACIQGNVESAKMHKFAGRAGDWFVFDNLYGADTLKYIKNNY